MAVLPYGTVGWSIVHDWAVPTHTHYFNTLNQMPTELPILKVGDLARLAGSMLDCNCQ